MKDIEPMVYDELYTYITTQYTDMLVMNEIIPNPPSLPCTCIEESNNAVDQSTIDSGSNENYANVDYEVWVYVNNVAGKRPKARAIMGYIDSWFLNKGFIRMNTSFVSFDDGTKFRTMCRYSAKTNGTTIFRR